MYCKTDAFNLEKKRIATCKKKKRASHEECKSTENMMTAMSVLHCGSKLAQIIPQVFVEISHFPAELHTFQ